MVVVESPAQDCEDECPEGGDPEFEPTLWAKFCVAIHLIFQVSLVLVIAAGALFGSFQLGKKGGAVSVVCPSAAAPFLLPIYTSPAPAGGGAGEIKIGAPAAPPATAPPDAAAPNPTVATTTLERGLLFRTYVVTVNCHDQGAGAAPGLGAPTGRGASQFYQQSPGGSAVRPNSAAGPAGGLAARTQDGLPASCTGAKAGDCENRWSMLSCSDQSQYWFKRGEAEAAVGQVDQAKLYFNEALRIGRSCGSEFANMAQKRLAALNLTCEYTPASLARISRGPQTQTADGNGGGIVDLRARQQALKALGHYNGEIDGIYGSSMRAAVVDFQREFGFSETGDLDPIETVYLVCAAAQTASDLKSTNILGLLYVTGLGVAQSTDIGMRWLKTAAERGSPDAMFNLALIYGTGIALSSYRLCEIVESTDIADAYLRDAAKAGHKVAAFLVAKYGSLGTAERWQRIEDDQLSRLSFYRLRLENVGRGCEPNPPGQTNPPKPI